jgi:DNA polymerase III alpha subunit
MFKDKYGISVYSESDICDYLLRNPDATLTRIVTDDPINDHDISDLEIENYPEIINHFDADISVEEFDRICQSNWYMPDEYKNLDIASWVLDQCKTQDQLQRTAEELLAYQELELFNLLRYLKYLVDTMRANGIVWGVGRGSSVSSYVLYLIGVHRIDSHFYDLDWHDFLK